MKFSHFFSICDRISLFIFLLYFLNSTLNRVIFYSIDSSWSLLTENIDFSDFSLQLAFQIWLKFKYN